MRDQGHVDGEARGVSFGAICRSLGDFVDLLSNLADRAGEEGSEASRSKTFGDDQRGLKAVYGFSVRLGGGRGPVVEQFGNVKASGGEGPLVEELREPMVDVFDEGDHLLLVAELPGVEEGDIRYEITGDVLCLGAVGDGRGYRKEVLLPATVSAAGAVSSYRNGVFELNLPKQELARE